MKSTGMVRQLDTLGRIVIPVELRRTMDSIPDAIIREYTERKYVHHGRMNQEI